MQLIPVLFMDTYMCGENLKILRNPTHPILDRGCPWEAGNRIKCEL